MLRSVGECEGAERRSWSHTPPLTPCSLAYLVRRMAPGSRRQRRAFILSVYCATRSAIVLLLSSKRSKESVSVGV